MVSNWDNNSKSSSLEEAKVYGANENRGNVSVIDLRIG